MASLLDHLFVRHPCGNDSSTYLRVLLTVAWLVLPQFAGAAYLYERFVREHIRKYITERQHLYGNHQQQSKKSPNNDGKAKKFFEFVTPKKKSDVAFVDPSHVIV
ncbi:hypothetical protein JHK82_027978 [Glycine max]|nr:hypothetical protein JHK82_027978 [Glycine max]